MDKIIYSNEVENQEEFDMEKIIYQNEIENKEEFDMEKIICPNEVENKEEFDQLDKFVYSINQTYSNIKKLSEDLKYGFSKYLFHVIESCSNDIIKELDTFVKISRKLRSELRRIGFSKLRKLDRTYEISMLILKTKNTHSLLVNIKNIRFKNINNIIFCNHIVHGEMMLDQYIDTLNLLKTTNKKWVEKFFNQFVLSE